MELTPAQLSGATFRTVRKGYDPDEVDRLLADAAAALEQAQQQAAAMEARARAAVARLQEQTDSGTPPPAAIDVDHDGVPRLSSDDADHISRTLLLAQHTADRAVAEAREEAERIIADARSEADSTLDSTREMSAEMLEEARVEARRVSEDERIAANDEVERLRARREFLLGDVDQLETFLVDQRDRLRSAAREIETLAERVPAGLGRVTPPPVSAAVDDDRTDGAEAPAGAASEESDDWSDEEAQIVLPAEAQMPFADASTLAEALDDDDLFAAGSVPDGSGEVVPDDTAELDATQVMEALHRPAPASTDADGAGGAWNPASD